MGSAFSQHNKFLKLELVQNEDNQTLRNADEIMDAIKSSRRKIKERIEFLELQVPPDMDSEREIAVLIRQDQYLEVLEGKEKSELAKIFLSASSDNCIVPEVLQWYQGPQ